VGEGEPERRARRGAVSGVGKLSDIYEAQRRLMPVPEPPDKAFVARVRSELSEAHARCLQVLASSGERAAHS
jgi:hypothetical protein